MKVFLQYFSKVHNVLPQQQIAHYYVSVLCYDEV